MIRLSNPQVFTREALIADRLRESRFLERELADSSAKVFAPQLYRDVAALSALTSQLGISFDPAAALGFRGRLGDFQRTSEVAQLSHEVEITRLRAELDRVTREFEAMQAGKGTGPEAPEAPAPQPPQPPSPGSPVESNAGAISQKLGELLTSTRTTLDRLAEDETKRARASQAEQSPETRYEDLRAYRSRIRADLGANNLDDAHDLVGNTLYRLQFSAVVFPGRKKNRWGIARVMAEAPVLSEEELRELYFTWLAHANYRLNRPGDSAPILTDPFYRQLGRETNLYDLVTLEQGRATFHLATAVLYGPVLRSFSAEPGSSRARALRELWSDLVEIRAFANPASDLEGWFRIEAPEAACAGTRFVGPTDRDEARLSGLDVDQSLKTSLRTRLRRLEASLKTARELLELAPSLWAITTGLEGRGLVPSDVAEWGPGGGTDLLSEFDDSLDAARGLNQLVWLVNGDVAKRCPQQVPDADALIEKGRGLVPERFREIVLAIGPAGEGDPDGRPGYRLGGRSYAYTAAPATRVQRLSTVASAANSAQTALAIAAAVPQSGISVDAGVGYAETAAGKVDALERAPLVVGFADGDQTKTAQAHFGWVFGPPVRIDADDERLRLRHSVRRYSVVADVSIPAWWPRVKLVVDSVWVRNWYDHVDYLDPAPRSEIWNTLGRPNDVVETAEIEVQLPRSRADMDTLSDQLKRSVFGQSLRPPRIDEVEPSVVNLCDRQYRLLVYGIDLWRDPQVFLGGHRHRAIEPLPDLTGISVGIDLGELPRRGSTREEVLTVVTRTGSTTARVVLEESDCRASGRGTLPVRVEKRHLAKSEALSIAADPGLLASTRYHKLFVGIRPAEGRALRWTWAEAAEGPGNVTAKSAFGANEPIWTLVGAARPVLAHAAVAVEASPGADYEISLAPGELVLYADANARTVRVDPGQIVRELPANVELKLPARFAEAFPSLATKRGRLASLRARKGKVEFRIVDESLDGRSYTVRVGPPSMSDADYQELRKNALAIGFAFENVDDAPAIEGTFTLGKRN